MQHSRIIDLTGKQYGVLTVLCYAGKVYKHSGWYCLCCCGTITKVSSNNLRRGYTKSCGCSSKEWTNVNRIKHEFLNSPEYRAWSSAKNRCYNKNNPSYKNYGGRGIRMCDRWNKSFINFIEDMGFKPGAEYSIERIDNDGDYSTENCKWVVIKDQVRNRRNTLLCNYRGNVIPLAEACENENIKYSIAYSNIYTKGIENFMGITKYIEDVA